MVQAVQWYRPYPEILYEMRIANCVIYTTIGPVQCIDWLDVPGSLFRQVSKIVAGERPNQDHHVHLNVQKEVRA